MGITATPQNAALAALSRALRSARDTGDKVDIPLLGGLGSLFLGKSPEEVEEWSYGNAPMHVPAMTRIPQVKQGRKQQLADTLFAAGDLSPLATAATRTVKAVPAALRHGAESFALAQSPAHVVKPKGGNWLAGSVEDALKGLKRGHEDSAIRALMRANPNIGETQAREFINAQVTPQDASINSWIEGPLTKYVKSRMASPDDEVRKLAEQGVLHVNPDGLRRPRQMTPLDDVMRQVRQEVGFPEEGVAQSQLAKDWEAASDALVGSYRPTVLSDSAIAKNPWLEKLAPEDRVHDINTGFGGRDMTPLGFPHLIDELSNALNPNSGLPRNLLLTPEAMKQLSMEKAVRRVAEINAWRAAQKAEANRKLAEQASIVRDYPHSDAAPNPKGLRWVELKTGDLDQSKLPENYTLREINPTGRGSFWAGEDVRTPGLYYGHGATPEEGLASFWKKYPANKERDALRQALQDQLKYEGDTMGHCVGGYCDDVLSGRSRIFSLRDAKGEPHVTVEVEPPMFNRASRWGDLSQKEKTSMLWNLGSPGDKALLEKYGDDVQVYFRPDNSVRIMPPAELLDPETIAKSLNPRVKQIKGKQNRAPNEEYLPFVQDFVRNSPLGGQWSAVGDLQNTGLWRNPKTGTFHTKAEAEADEALGALYDSRNLGPNGEYLGNRFAQGGSVETSPDGAESVIMPASWDVFFTE